MSKTPGSAAKETKLKTHEKKKKNPKKLGIDCVHVGSASAERFSGSEQKKHYIHEIDVLVSLDRAE